MAEGGLQDIRVVELGDFMAVPFCGKLLADYGADVIKVEPPEGDSARRAGPFPQDDPNHETSGTFLYLNTSKRGITLSPETESGAKLLRELAGSADVLLEGFKPGTLDAWGLGYADLERINPKLIMVSVTPFGQDGPYSSYRATDLASYAMGGFMYVTGPYDRAPVRHGGQQSYYWGGATAAVATLTALFHQRETGEGQHVDVSIMESLHSALQLVFSYYTYMGAILRRLPRVGAVFEDNLPTRDGYIAPYVGVGGGWDVFAAFMNRPELLDPKYEAVWDRMVTHSVELRGILEDAFRERNKFDVFHEAQEWRFPFGVVQTPDDLAKCPQLDARQFWTQSEHPIAGTLTYPGAPFKASEAPWQISRPAPLLGQHNEEIYCNELGYSQEDLVRLRERNII